MSASFAPWHRRFQFIIAILTNVIITFSFCVSDTFPFIGLSVTLALLVSTLLRRPDWEIIPESVKGSIFLLSLVLCATLMPVQSLPNASWQTALASVSFLRCSTTSLSRHLRSGRAATIGECLPTP